jgi:hypothetical protein
LGGSSNIYSQSCSEYSSRFKILDDGRILTTAGNYLGIGNSYSSDCDNFNYIEVSETGYKFNIRDISTEKGQLVIQKENNDCVTIKYHISKCSTILILWYIMFV